MTILCSHNIIFHADLWKKIRWLFIHELLLICGILSSHIFLPHLLSEEPMDLFVSVIFVHMI